MNHLIGYCKECGCPVYDSDGILGYKNIFECPNCNHSHSKDELWDEVPYYIKSSL